MRGQLLKHCILNFFLVSVSADKQSFIRGVSENVNLKTGSAYVTSSVYLGNFQLSDSCVDNAAGGCNAVSDLKNSMSDRARGWGRWHSE